MAPSRVGQPVRAACPAGAACLLLSTWNTSGSEEGKAVQGMGEGKASGELLVQPSLVS